LLVNNDKQCTQYVPLVTSSPKNTNQYKSMTHLGVATKVYVNQILTQVRCYYVSAAIKCTWLNIG